MTSVTNNSQVVKPTANPSPAAPVQGVASIAIDPIAAKLEYDLRGLSPQIRDLIQKVEKLGKFTIVLVDHIPGGGYDPVTRQISINKNLQHNNQLSLIIFELLNAEKQTEFARVDEEARRGLHTKETYGEAIERIEFVNTGTHHDLVQGLPKEFDLFSWVSFPDYLKAQITNGHTDYYYQTYEQNGFLYLGTGLSRATNLVRCLRGISPKILAQVQKVEKLLGKLPAIVLADNLPGSSRYDPQRQEIHVDKDLPACKQLSRVIFELINTERFAEYGRICDAAGRGLHTKDSFAEGCENITFINTILHRNLVEGLVADFRLFPWVSFDEYLTHHQQNGHIHQFHQYYEQSGFHCCPEVDWSSRNNPAARLEGDLRAMPKNIVERIRSVEQLLGKFPTIVFVDDNVTSSSYYDPATQRIHINKNLSHNKQLGYLLFELLTIERHLDHMRVYEEAVRGQHTEASYGAAFKKIEHENAIAHHRLVQGLPAELDVFRWCRSMSSQEYVDHAHKFGFTEPYYQNYRDRQFRYLGPAQTTPA